MTAALRLVLGEFADRPGVPFLPELPGRGVGADLTGRGAALLADLYTEVQPSGWRIADRPGRDHRRAMGYLSSDLDLLEEHTQGYTGPLKIQAVGPWTLAATVELPHGDKLLADRGAVRDVAASLAEGLRRHVEGVRRRVPGAQVVLQLDEPALPGVLRGSVPTASGFGLLRSVDEQLARETLRRVIEAAEVPVIVHCCAGDMPFGLLRDAGAAGLSFDLGLIGEKHDDAIGRAIETGMTLFAGVVPTLEPASAPTYKMILDRILALGRLGFPGKELAESLVVTPACGLAGASPQWAARALKLCADAARALQELD
jgi:methionine synthase II (cobalamin-independent)